MPERGLTYPTDHLLAVVDDPEAARAAAERLLSAGFVAADVTILQGDADADRIDGLGAAHGLPTRLLRMVQFMTMDQMPDFRLYEAAIRTGRTVVAVRARERPAMLRARDVLADAGAHFMNYYGRLSTEELSRWRGPELELPGFMRR